MLARRFGGGLPAASFALLLFLASMPASAGPALGWTPWWAAAPVQAVGVLPTGQVTAPAPVVADSRWAWRAAQGYRWRPMEPARMAPPPAVGGWAPRLAPPRFAVDAPAVGNPWGRLPPPRVAAWRAPAPMIVTVDGTPYRFRPAVQWRGPMVAQTGRMAGPIVNSPYAALPPPPMLAAQWPVPATRAAVLPPGQPWLQPPGRASGAPWYGYRFRPDARFASHGPPVAAPAPWRGQPRAFDSRGWNPAADLRAMPGEPTDPRSLSAGTVAYLYD